MSEYKAAIKKFRTFRDDLTSTFQVLENTPEAGDRMKYADSYVFKIRIGVRGSGIGKSGGYRLIYHVDQARLVITPLTLYFKRDIENIAVSELGSRLSKLAKYIEDRPTLIAPPSPPEILH
jgi:mRNA-degrading endonuclease RelE of RelBE toxin-antitoxin system